MIVDGVEMSEVGLSHSFFIFYFFFLFFFFWGGLNYFVVCMFACFVCFWLPGVSFVLWLLDLWVQCIMPRGPVAG